MAPLAVDPDAMFTAGSAVAAVGEDLVAALGSLTAGFGANTGQDAAGDMFGLAYQDAAKSLLKAAAAAINACRHNGAKIQLSASNYSRAEAASTLGGGSGVLPAPHDPEQFSAPGPPGTLGAGPPPPMLWRVVELFVGDMWPNGDVAGLHAAAGCWRGFAAALGGAEQGLNGPKAVIAGQEIPEGPLIQPVLSELGATMASLGEQCERLAATLDNFADEVAHAQNAIRDLLHRLGSASGVWHEVVSIFDGDALQEVKEIADDIKAVLHNLGREAQAKEQAMQRGMGIADGLVRGMQRYVRGELTHFLGTEVGNPLATVFDFFSNVTEGVYQAAFSTVHGMDQLSPRHFLTDPEGAAAAWEGLDVTAVRSLPAYALLDPDGAAQTWKGLLHLDDWSRDRPGLGLGENLFDVGTLALGAGEVRRFGTGGRAVEEVVAEEERSGGTRVETPGGGGQLGEITHTGDALTTELKDLGGDLPKTDPKTSGEPSALPTGEPPRAPVEATNPAESTTPSTTKAEPPTAPTGSTTSGPGGSHEPATPVGARPSPAPAAAGDQMLSSSSRLTEPTPASVAPDGTPVKQAPVVTAPASPAPQASAPRFEPPAGPNEVPGSRSISRHNFGGGESRANCSAQASPHGGGPREQSGPASRQPHEHPHGGELPRSGDGASANQPPGSQDGAGERHDVGAHQPGHQQGQALAGRDYPLAPDQALQVLSNPGAEIARLADGKVPAHILENYDPLSGRTLADFERDFTVRGHDGKLAWDWENQAPNNGFDGTPEVEDHIPQGLPLDRIGPNGGAFMSVEGAPLAERATPPGLASQYHTMSGSGTRVPDGWVVLHGPAKAAFGQPGGAEQWLVIDELTGNNVPVEVLNRTGIITDLTP